MSELAAVVDLGSTAVRLLLTRIKPHVGYRVLVEERVPTRLGGGAPGTLPRKAIDKTLRAVHRFLARYSRKDRGPRVVAVALAAVRTSRRLGRHDPPTSRELQGLRTEVRRHLLGALPSARRGEVMIGLGGTIRALATMHLRAHRGHRKHRHGLRLRQSDVTAMRERLEDLSRRKRGKLRGLKPERADIILA